MGEKYNGPSVDDDGPKEHDHIIPASGDHDINARMGDIHHELDMRARAVVRHLNFVLNANDPKPYEERVKDHDYIIKVIELRRACTAILARDPRQMDAEIKHRFF